MKSRRVIVAGVGPIPPHESDRLYAPGLRLWMFADEIEKRGHHGAAELADHLLVRAEADYGQESLEVADALDAFDGHIAGYARFVCEHYETELGFEVWDLMFTVWDRKNRDLYIVGDGHPNDEGHLVLAEGMLHKGLRELLPR